MIRVILSSKIEIKELWFGLMLLLLMVYPMVSFGVLFHSTCKIVFLTSALFKISEIKLNYNEIFIKSNILM